MANLKDLRDRIGSVKATRKITSAMKMVAAAKLRKAQQNSEDAKPYAMRIDQVLARVMLSLEQQQVRVGHPLMQKRKKIKTHLVVVVSSERGLCGGFNHRLLKEVRQHISQLIVEGKTVKIFCIGKKGYDLLKSQHGDKIISHFSLTEEFDPVQRMARVLIQSYKQNLFDQADLFYNRFRNTMVQIPQQQVLIPFEVPQHIREKVEMERKMEAMSHNNSTEEKSSGWYIFEPNAASLLETLIPAQITARLYHVLLDVEAGEHASRMTAMDSATRNAGDMIDNLTTTYNRERQAYITREVTEIVSAAEAL